jgi:hypothetical protein
MLLFSLIFRRWIPRSGCPLRLSRMTSRVFASRLLVRVAPASLIHINVWNLDAFKKGGMESGEAVTVAQALRLGQFWHARKHAANL